MSQWAQVFGGPLDKTVSDLCSGQSNNARNIQKENRFKPAAESRNMFGGTKRYSFELESLL